MDFFNLFILNIFIYLLNLKIGFILYADKYWFPLRLADLFAFFTTTFFSCLIILYNLDHNYLLIFLIINLNILYIFFHLINLIITSPRTKIVLDLYLRKKINKREYFRIYNYDIMIRNRLKRLQSNNQLIINKDKIKLNSKFGLFSIISLVFLWIRIF